MLEQFKGETNKSKLQTNFVAQMMETTIQSYFKDAIRNVEIKIFKAEVWLSTGL